MPAPGVLSAGFGPLRRHTDDPLGGTAVAPELADELRRSSSGGAPLPDSVAGPLATHFGQDLSGLRVHADDAAARLAGAVRATAFTHGEHLYFASGAYRPNSPDGQHVLAHEVSHVVAQRSGADRGRASGGLTIGRADDPAEAAADRAADAAVGSLRRSAALPPAALPGAPGQASALRRSVADAAVVRRRLGSKKKAKSGGKAGGSGAPAPAVPGHQGLAPVAAAAFAAARAINTDYDDLEQATEAWIPQEQQKKISDIGGKTSNIKDKTKAKEKRALKDLVRASLMADFTDIIGQKIATPHTDAGEYAKPTDEEQQRLDTRYFPRTLQNRDKVAGLLDKGPSAAETQTWLAYKGFAAAIPRTDDQLATDAGGPRVDVRATFIGGTLLGAPRRMHLFIVYTSSDGDQFYFRGGPDSDTNPMTVADFGPYDPESIDWDPAAPSVTIAKGEKAKSKFDGLLHAVTTIDAMQVPYVASTGKANTGGLGGLEAFVSGENCNSVAWTLLDKAGLPKKKPSGLHPGWGHELGKLLKQGTGVIAPPEDDTNTRPAVVLGPADKTKQVFADRIGSEKLIELPGGTPVNLVVGVATRDCVKITVGPKSQPGWIRQTDVGKPPKQPKAGRKFWVGGRPDGMVVIIVKGNREIADVGSEILVLDDSFVVGGAGKDVLVKVRYTDKYLGTVEGKMFAEDITDVDPKTAPPPKAKDPDAGKDAKGKAGQQAGPPPKPVGMKPPLQPRPPGKLPDVGEQAKLDGKPGLGDSQDVKTSQMIPLFNEDGTKHRFGGVNAKPGTIVRPTGEIELTSDDTTMVEFVVQDPNVRAWMPAGTWLRLFGRKYPGT